MTGLRVRRAAREVLREAPRFVVPLGERVIVTTVFGRRHPRAAEHHHGALDAEGAQVAVGAVELERQPHRTGPIALQEVEVVLGEAVAGAGEDGLQAVVGHGGGGTGWVGMESVGILRSPMSGLVPRPRIELM